MPRFDPGDAIALIEQHRITAISLVPTVARLLLERIEAMGAKCESLRLITATGEAFPEALKARLSKALPHVGLWVFYGMTEGGIPAEISPEEQKRKPGSVGLPIAGVEIRLVDESGTDVPAGESGEVWLRSGTPGRAMVSREYFNRPEANRDAYRDGWFRTGDLGRFDDDGYLYLVDRVKDMILSGGLNIYSREVENALEAAAPVREVAVVAGPDDVLHGEADVAQVAVGGDVHLLQVVQQRRALVPRHVGRAVHDVVAVQGRDGDREDVVHAEVRRELAELRDDRVELGLDLGVPRQLLAQSGYRVFTWEIGRAHV